MKKVRKKFITALLVFVLCFSLMFVLTSAMGIRKVVLFSDNLNRTEIDLEKWDIYSGQWEVHEEELIQTDENEELALVTIKDKELLNCTVDFDIKIAHSVGTAGIIVRKTNQEDSHLQSGYLISLDSDGILMLLKQGLIEEVYDTGINPKNEFVTITAELKGNRISIYLNGEINPAISVVDSSFSGSYISLFTANTSAYFDNIIIRRAEADEEMVPGNLPQNMVDARVKVVRGIPRLFINGKVTEPIMFSGNNIGDQFDGLDAIERQIQKASNNNINMVAIEIDHANIERSVQKVLDLLLRNNPEAYIMLRFSVWGSSSFFGLDWRKEDFKSQTGVTRAITSLASDSWLDKAERILRNVIRTVLNNPIYIERVIGYHFYAGDTCEWFGPQFWNGEVDHSVANINKFRSYLRDLYGTDDELRRAWGNNTITFDSVTIPKKMPGRGVGHDRDKIDETFLLSPSNRIYVDYLDYYSNMIAGRIAHLSSVVKEETEGKSLAVSFYGYPTEVRVPVSGSFGLAKLLESPDIDIIAGPVGYGNRNEGGVGAYMPFVDTVAAAGKIWYDEADFRSPVWTSPGFAPDEPTAVGGETTIKSVENLREVIKREIGKCMVHKTGLWIYDLIARGWYDDNSFWQEVKGLQQAYEKYTNYQKDKKTPDVAVILDEKAMSILGDPWQMGQELLNTFRNDLYSSGLSFGMYLMEDILNDKALDAKLYIMLTPWRLDSESARKVSSVVNRKGKTTVWVYGNGMTSTSDFEMMSGFKLKAVKTGSVYNSIQLNSEATRLLTGMTNGQVISGSSKETLHVVESENVTPLGMYQNIDGIGMAAIERNGAKSIFFGGTKITGEMLRSWARYAGINVYMDTDEAFYTNDGLAVLHTKTSGKKTITFPEKCDVYNYYEGKWYKDVSSLQINASQYKTYFLFYGEQAKLQKAGIGR